MKKVLFLLFSVLVYDLSIAQVGATQSLLPGWQRIWIENVGTIDLPPTLEVQAGTYKKHVDEFKRENGLSVGQLVAQQKGLNEYKKEAFSKYARVIFNTTYGMPGDYERLNFDINQISGDELRLLDNTYRQQVESGLARMGIKIIKWYPVKAEHVNGMSCIHVSYIRQLGNNPYVLVNTYVFPNYDRLHTLTLSYRLSEKDYWQDDFRKILKSLRITNVR